MLNADLNDRQLEYQTIKSDRASAEQQLWDIDDALKHQFTQKQKEEHKLNDIVHEHQVRQEELTNLDLEMQRHEAKLDKLNAAIDSV